MPQRSLKVVFNNGSEYRNYEDARAPDIEIVFKNARGQRRLVIEGYTGFFEAYIDGDVDILGERAIYALARTGMEAGLLKKRFLTDPLLLMKQWLWERRISNHDWAQARRNAEAHYNLPGEFFRILLGETYGYCEGYYRGGYGKNDAKAQHDRFDYVCKKLLLKPGDKLIEVGSGWGYMSVLAAQKYGADVVNYGIVPEQNKVMRRMIEEKGLAEKVRIVDRDHRALVDEPEAYDKYVSLGVY